SARATPLTAVCPARASSRGWFAGLSPAVREVGGKLAADLDVRGTPAAPRLRGPLEWSHGAGAMADLGRYRDVHARLRADDKTIALDEFAAESGNGRARLTG